MSGYITRAALPGECVSRDNPMICRVAYPGESACTAAGGVMRCLKSSSPLILTINDVEPYARDWLRANKLIDHPRRCRCSTCALAAKLGHVIRRQEGKRT